MAQQRDLSPTPPPREPPPPLHEILARIPPPAIPPPDAPPPEVPENVIHDTQKSKSLLSWKKSENRLPSEYLNIHSGSDKNVSKERKDSCKNSSTLSLHIAAYENSIEAAASDSFEEINISKDQSNFTKRSANVKHMALLSSLNNPFEFPRQQTDYETDPAVMQFTASQQLLNPNQSSSTTRNVQPVERPGINGSGPAVRQIQRTVVRSSAPVNHGRLLQQAPTSGRNMGRRLESQNNIAATNQAQSKRTYMVCYDRASARKHKLYKYDGFFEVTDGKSGRFLDQDREQLAYGPISRSTAEALEEFGAFTFDGYDIESHEEIQSIYSAREVIAEQPTKVLSNFIPVVPTKSNPTSSVQQNKNEQIKVTSAISSKSLVKEVQPSISKPEAVPADAFIIQEPSEKYPNGVHIAPVLAKVMRDHQKDGVKFLFNALHEGNNGAILADDMGLGKTLQSIALIHTMVNTKLASKYKLVNRVLLICPLSLRQNWLDEFEKWGIRNFCYMPGSKDEVERYIAISSRTPVCILNYNIVASYGKILKMSKFDLMICDEGHVLKNTTKIRKTLLDLPSKRRVILTGTPIQNNLKEFYQLTTFVHPTLFESMEDFGQQIQEKKGDAFSSFFLRRTAEVNQRFLPPRHDFLVFCQPSPLQTEVYGKALDVIPGNTFSMFNAFRQICNHPALLYKNLRSPEYIDFARCINAYPEGYDAVNLKCQESGKLATLAAMIVNFRNENDKTVIVSQSTQCLSLIGQLVKTLKFKVYRLDGKTAPEKRQKRVTNFNASEDPNDIFLLSTNAGGVGLNLIGANRLIMFDCSWNPATDFQAMGRTWREGQKKKVYIYRLFTAGTVEEKFLQLQIKKTGLATIVNPWMTWKKKEKEIDLSELKNYDEFVPGIACDTHDAIKCHCEGNGNYEVDDEDDWYDQDEGDDMDMECDGEEIDVQEDDEEEDFDNFYANQDKSNVYARVSLDQLYKWRHHSHGSESFDKILDDCGLFDDSPVSFIMETEFIPPDSNQDDFVAEEEEKEEIAEHKDEEEDSQSDMILSF